MPEIIIRRAEPDDAASVLAMLKALAEVLGEAPLFRSTEALLRRHGWGEAPLFRGTLAFEGDVPVGLALYFPTFSTLRGAPGVYVQDLYVAEAARGTGLGRRLLQAALREAEAGWGASHLTLTVHGGNRAAQAFYRRLGFELREGELPASLDGPAFTGLRDHP